MTRRRNGFTLLELLTVIAVLAVVTTIGMRALFRISDLWRLSEIRMNLNARANQTFELMRHDFDQVLSAKLSGVPLRGAQHLEEKKRFGRVRLENDLIILPVEYVNPLTHSVERQSVMYHINREAATPSLIRTLGALDALPPMGARQLVAEGVIAMRLEYHDGAEWMPEWNRAGLPEAVRVNLVLADANRPYEQIARKAVFAIHVK